MKKMSSVIAVLIAQTGQIERTTALTMTTKKQRIQKLSFLSQETIDLPDNLRGPNISSYGNRQTHICDNSVDVNSSVHNFIDNKVGTWTDTDIVHIGRKSQNECAVMVNAGKRSFKALWDSVAGRCVVSYECYNKISPKFKSDLFRSDIRLKAANGTFIRNKGECEISFKIGQEGFRFLFLCSDQLSQELILGHNFAQSFHNDTLWNANDVMSLTRNGKPFAHTLHTNDINALVFSTESIVIPPFSNAFIKCKMPKVKRQAHLGKTCVFEPSVRNKAVYTGCTTYEGIVTIAVYDLVVAW